MADIRISQLFSYPLKSASGIALDAVDLDAMGVSGDRRWMVVDEFGDFISQRQHPKMCLIKVSMDENGLAIHIDGYGTLALARAAGAILHARVWDDLVEAEDCGDMAAQWLEGFLGQACRLVYMPDNYRREVDKTYASHGELLSFADGFPLLLISEASLVDLNGRLQHLVAMSRFRPNLVVSGCEPFAEDSWQRIKIGGVVLEVVKPCSRCVIPSIDPKTAEKQPEVLRVLAGYRRRAGTIYFGQNLLHSGPGRLVLGNRVEVLA